MINDIHKLSCEERHIVFTQAYEHYTINVFENEEYRWLTFGGDLIQSLISLSEPDSVLFPYTKSMLLALAQKQKPLKLLSLGSGCGTFERFLSKHYSDISVTSVESNIDIINISSEYFYMPSHHLIINKSANDFVNTTNTKYDIILCDIHDGIMHSDCLNDVVFYQNIKKCLVDDGVLVINIIPDDERSMLDKLLSIRKVFGWQHLLDFENYKNIILYIYMREPKPLDFNCMLNEKLNKHLNIDYSEIVRRLILMPTIGA